MALVKDRVLARYSSQPHRPEFGGPVAAGSTVYRGSICAVCTDGTIVPVGAVNPPASPVAVLGLAEHQQINTTNFPGQGAFVGGSAIVTCRKGTWKLPFDTAPGWGDVHKPVYAVDDEIVSLTQTPTNGTARLQVGTLSGFDNGAPCVEIV